MAGKKKDGKKEKKKEKVEKPAWMSDELYVSDLLSLLTSITGSCIWRHALQSISVDSISCGRISVSYERSRVVLCVVDTLAHRLITSCRMRN